jgi:hypothetical protein
MVGFVKYNGKKPYIRSSNSDLNEKRERYFLCPQVPEPGFAT